MQSSKEAKWRGRVKHELWWGWYLIGALKGEENAGSAEGGGGQSRRGKI